MNAVETYLDRLHEIHATMRGTPELSYRAALENLLNAVGLELDPPVQAMAEPEDAGSGHPDYLLIETRSGNQRGCVEVKSFADEPPETADGKQVTKYWKQYGYVLVTNYRDFLLVVRQPDGEVRVEGRYVLAADAETFWSTKYRELDKEHGEGLIDFLSGALTRSAPITLPSELAADLARHAREARRRLFRQDTAALDPLKQAMTQALGLHFDDRDGETFFRSSLVQTLFYGLFSGWMLWRQEKHKPGSFDWHYASEYLALPLIGDLYEEIAKPKRLADLNLREPLDWATTSLNRVDETAFFSSFDADHAITLFYEPFLQAFDPNLRKELGVWYTPPEIVQYMVERVDQLLRSELGIADGLADDNVVVLDPAAGTGSYLIEVAKRIHRTLDEQGYGNQAAKRVKNALATRIFGFEILAAPYVVAHLQLGILLRSLGTPLTGKERCEVYLTNSLTGWEPPKGAKATMSFPELQQEAERAARVKQQTPILVILGNPPYNGFAGVAEDEEAGLIEPYKTGLYENWGVRKQLLDDLYIRFFRLAEKRIAEVGGRGIVCFISNYSWLDGLSHPVMRERIATQFDTIWIDNCNGDKYKTGKRTPDGLPDQSMFTTDEHPIGIQVGTAIATLVKKTIRKPDSTRVAAVRYRDFWGTGDTKREQLLACLSTKGRSLPKYVTVIPRPTMRWVFVNGELGKPTVYESWPKLAEMFAEVYKGVQPGRGGSLVSIDRAPLIRQMRDYYDPKFSAAELREWYPHLMRDEARYDASEMRRILLSKKVRFSEHRILPIEWVPFDRRWLYSEKYGKLLNEKRAEFQEQVREGNLFLACTQKPRKGKVSPPLITACLGSYYVFDPYTTYFPLRVRHNGLHQNGEEPGFRPEFLEAVCQAFGEKSYREGGADWTDAAQRIGDDLFHHIIAILWSPAYRTENNAALRQDWPRIPIPADPKSLDASAKLGRLVGDLLLPDKPVKGVTVGSLKPELRGIGVETKIGKEPLDPAKDYRVEAGYGFHGQKNAVMCGKGKVIPAKADPDNAVDVFINDRVCWANVPTDVWELTIGGYPVIKKWLSYREFKILDRPLSDDEMNYITEVIRRLKALILLGPELDENYRTCSEKTLDISAAK